MVLFPSLFENATTFYGGQLFFAPGLNLVNVLPENRAVAVEVFNKTTPVDSENRVVAVLAEERRTAAAAEDRVVGVLEDRREETVV
jgi:hypothetical protein